MTQERINYIFSAVLVVLALILGWFGMTLPVAPEMPSPLPTPDLSGYVTAEELALVQRNIEAMQVTGGESFTVSGDSSYSTDCYQKQGGSEWVADSGCTWAVLDGGTLEVQSGATFDIAGYFSSTVTSLTAGTGLITGNLTVSGTSDLVGNISSSTGGVSITDALIVGIDGTSYNVTFYSDTAGDYFFWDQANEALTLIGTNGQDALNVDDGNVDIEDDLDVNGATSLDDVNVDGAISSAAGAVTVTDGLIVTGILDAQGTIINSGGTLTINDHLDVANTLNYGTANLYALGAEDSNFQFSWGGQTITGTAALTNQKVGQPTAAWCTIAQAPAGAGTCTTSIVGTTVSASVWLTTGVASAVGVAIDWLVIGAP